MALIYYCPKLIVDQATGRPVTALKGEVGAVIQRGNPAVKPTIFEDPAGTVVIGNSELTVTDDTFVRSFYVDEAFGPVSFWGGGVEIPLETTEGIAIRLDDLESLFDETAAAAAASAASAQGSQLAAETAASAAATALPTGGTTGQALVKLSNTNRHVGWATISGGGGGGSVTSVAGKTGDVSLVKGDVGLGQVDNTSDANKPVSGPQATALAAKANASHTHPVAQVDGLQAALDSKAGVNAPVNASQVNAGTGVINPARLGTGVASGTTFLRGDGQWATPPGGGSGGAVNSVNGQSGDVILDAADVGALPDTYTAPVVQVAGKTGVVTLAKGDVGLGAVDNTADADKPVSVPTQTALDAKAADNAVVKLTGNQTVGGVKTFSSAPVVPDGSFTQAKVSGLTAALTGKVGSSAITTILPLSQTAYDAITTKDPATLYLVTGA